MKDIDFTKILKSGWKTSEGQLATYSAVIGQLLAILVTVGLITQVGADNILNSLQGVIVAGGAFITALVVFWRSLAPLIEYIKGRNELKRQVNFIAQEAVRKNNA